MLQHADAAELHLLFAKGQRPDRGAIRAFIAQQQTVAIGTDPAEHAAPNPQAGFGNAGATRPQTNEQGWIELLREGLSFDLHGLAPGTAPAFPAVRHRFDLPLVPTAEAYDSLVIVPGPHLAAGARSLPVLKGMLGLARDLTQHFDDLAAAAWAPSCSAIGRRFFESVITAWLDGGPFPALGLIAFEPASDDALQSLGLDFWIGQELRIEAPLSADRVAATRLGIRLVNQLVIVGALLESERIIAPDGTRLVMHPSSDRKLIRVWRE